MEDRRYWAWRRLGTELRWVAMPVVFADEVREWGWLIGGVSAEPQPGVARGDHSHLSRITP